MPREKITFEGTKGVTLSARLDKPEGEMHALVLFAHCFTCGKDLSTINRIAKRLNDQGIALFRFDFTGLGHSEGEFSNTNFSSNIGDLIAAADYLRNEVKAPDILVGHSLGGAAVLAAAGKIDSIKAVATIAAPCDSAHVLHLFGDQVEEIRKKGKATVNLAGRTFTIKAQFIDDVKGIDMKRHIENLNRPLLIMHAPQDKTVGVENARSIFETARHPKSFVALDGADHLLMEREKDGIFVADILAAWAVRYI